MLTDRMVLAVVLEPHWNFPKSSLKINKASDVQGKLSLGCELPQVYIVDPIAEDGMSCGRVWAGAGRGELRENFPCGADELLGELSLLRAVCPLRGAAGWPSVVSN